MIQSVVQFIVFKLQINLCWQRSCAAHVRWRVWHSQVAISVCAVVMAEAPWNFSWVVHKKLAAMAWPQTEDNLRYILGEGVTHLITLSPEMLPPVHSSPTLSWTLIAVPEFEAPSLNQISEFIGICEETEQNNGVTFFIQ